MDIGEIAAVAKLLGLNDNEFKDNPYYPDDLAHWADYGFSHQGEIRNKNKMKRFILLSLGTLLIGLCCNTASAQQYTMKYIHQKSDSVIRANVDERIPVKYRMWSNVVNYQYAKGKSTKTERVDWSKTNVEDFTQGDFRGAELKYHIYFRDMHKVGWESFGLPIDTIHIDADFNLISTLKIGRIPSYILNNDTTKFLTYAQADSIINSQFPVNRFTKEIQEHYVLLFAPYLEQYPEPRIRYTSKLLFERNLLRHHWKVTQIVRCAKICGYIGDLTEEKKKFGDIYDNKDLERTFYIDALTGEIISEGYFSTCRHDW